VRTPFAEPTPASTASAWRTGDNTYILRTMADSMIKPDPDAPGASPAPFDDDIYEDAGDLEFNTDPAFRKLYLARVPRYVWEAWSKLDEDAEIQIGTIRIETTPNPDGGNPKVCYILTVREQRC
jgi:hypothetical protein